MGVTGRFFELTQMEEGCCRMGGTEMLIVMATSRFVFFTVEHCLLTQTSHLFFLTTENRLTPTQDTVVPSLSGVFLAFWTQCFSSFIEPPFQCLRTLQSQALWRSHYCYASPSLPHPLPNQSNPQGQDFYRALGWR